MNSSLYFGGPEGMMRTFTDLTGAEFDGYLLTGFVWISGDWSMSWEGSRSTSPAPCRTASAKASHRRRTAVVGMQLRRLPSAGYAKHFPTGTSVVSSMEAWP